MNTPTPSIKDIIKGNIVFFNRFRAGIFYYRVDVRTPDSEETVIYEFPVHLGDGSESKEKDPTQFTLLHQDKAIYFMKPITRALKMKEFVRV